MCCIWLHGFPWKCVLLSGTGKGKGNKKSKDAWMDLFSYSMFSFWSYSNLVSCLFPSTYLLVSKRDWKKKINKYMNRGITMKFSLLGPIEKIKPSYNIWGFSKFSGVPCSNINALTRGI